MNARALAVIAAAVAMLVNTPAHAADAEAGKKSFGKCAACHAIEAGKNKVGPSLAGVYGRKAGAVEGFKYSAAMKDSGVTWDDKNLNSYIEAPSAFVKGNKMTFVGVKDPAERANIIAYLQTLK